MGLIEGVTYYYIPDEFYTNTLLPMASWTNDQLEQEGYSITAGQLADLVNDFSSPAIEGIRYVGEDHIDEDEQWFLLDLGYGDTWTPGRSGELLGGA